MGQTSIATRVETLERFNRLKDELNEEQPDAPDHNADSFLNAMMDEWEDRDDDTSGMGVAEYQRLLDRLDRIESAASTTEDRTGSIQNTLEKMGGR